MLQAMNTGHEGSLTTIHANTPRDALSRLETLVMTGGVELPHRAIREQISSAFDVLVQISRLVDGSRRVTHITEVLRMESDVITLQDLFVAKPPEEGHDSDPRVTRLLAPLACTGPEAALPREDGLERRPPAADVLPAGVHGRPPGLRRRRRTEAGSEAPLLSAVALVAVLVPGVGGAAGGNPGSPAVDTSAYPTVRVDRRHAAAGRQGAQADRERPAGRRLPRSNLGREKSVMLLFDRSQSMLGQAIAGRDPRPPASSSARSLPATGSRSSRSARRPFQLTGFSPGPGRGRRRPAHARGRQGAAAPRSTTGSSSRRERSPPT